MLISVVIPTCNRKTRLLSLLSNLNQSRTGVSEVIVIDAGDDPLLPADHSAFQNLEIYYLRTTPSVCAQRNIGIRRAKGDLIFICDDDIEVPIDYLTKLCHHLDHHPTAGAVSGIILQKEAGEWKGRYPVTSTFQLLWRHIFQLGIWGEINCKDNFINRGIKKIYRDKGNHLSRAGWPVITNFTGDYFDTPVYALGASLVKREWLLISPYDENLDQHGIGDNYGVCIGFPGKKVQVVTDASVYHHQEEENRLNRSEQYYRRVLALDYFSKTKKNQLKVKTRWLIWSLFGNFLLFILVLDAKMIRASIRSIFKIMFEQNPYVQRSDQKEKIIKPVL